MACALVIGVVALWCKHQVMRKLGITIEGPNVWYYVVVIKLKSFTCNHQVLTLELRAARQFFIDYVVEFIGRAIRKSKSVCNSHCNCMPDLGKLWCSKDLGLSVGAVDTRHEGTRPITSLGLLSTRTLVDMSTRCKRYLAPFVSVNKDEASWQANETETSSD